MKKRRLFLAVLALQLLSGCASIHRTKTVVWNYPYDDVVKHFYIGDSMDQAPDTMVVYGEVPAFDIKLYYSSDQDYLYQLTDNFLRNNDYKLISSSIKDGEDDKKLSGSLLKSEVSRMERWKEIIRPVRQAVSLPAICWNKVQGTETGIRIMKYQQSGLGQSGISSALQRMAGL